MTDPGRSAADRLWRLWQAGRRPDLAAFLAEAGPLGPPELAAVLRVDQSERWAAGEAVPAEEYLERYPAVAADPEAAVDLIHHEYMLAERAGRAPDGESFARRFPAHTDTLRLQMDLHRAVATRSVGADPTPSAGPHPDGLPERFGRYRILGLLGRGGMGAVYAAHDSALDRRVALKVPAFGPGDPEAVTRFYREARIAAGLADPHLCPVYDVGEVDGIHYLTMPVVEGESLADRLRRAGPLPPAEAARLVATVARAVGVAHAAGVVHRDLKPANLMLDPKGAPVVMDFGLARGGSAGGAGLTASGVFVGTPAYAAPEQLAGGGAASPAADVYALGAVLFECLTGRPPFAGPPEELLRAKLTAEPDPPSAHARGVPAELDAVCLKALARSPDRRFGSMDELTAAVEAYRPGRPTRRPNRRRVVALAVGGLLALGAGLLAVWPGAEPGGEAGDRPARPPGDPLPAQSLWVGQYSFSPEAPGSWKPALLWVTERDGPRFRGQAETDDGDYAWAVEGAVEGDRVGWRYVRPLREKEPTRSAENGAHAEGRWDASGIEAGYHDPGDGSRAAIRLRPADRDSEAADARATRAWALNDAGRHDLAVPLCDLAVRLDDRCVSALTCRANSHIKKRLFRPALADLDRVIEIDPGDASAISDRAWAWNEMGEYGRAAADALRAVQVDPKSAGSYYQLGRARQGEGKHQEAVDALTTGIGLRPDDAWAFLMRGKSHQALGDAGQAEADFVRAKKLDPAIPIPD